MSAQTSVSIYPDLKGKRVLITGGSAGIGEATAIALSKNGATVTIVARTVSNLEKVVNSLPTKGYYVKVDLTKPKEIEQAAQEAIEQMGGIDILINNGAVTNMQITDPLDADVLHHLLDIHVVACMRFIQACKDQLIANKGIVVNVSSVASQFMYEPLFPYCIAKAAQDALTFNMAMLWAQYGIRVNSVNPAVVDTSYYDRLAASKGVSKEEIWMNMDKLHAMGKHSQPQEQANTILFLCSESGASHMTGNNLFSDGGMRLTSWVNMDLMPKVSSSMEE